MNNYPLISNFFFRTYKKWNEFKLIPPCSYQIANWIGHFFIPLEHFNVKDLTTMCPFSTSLLYIT